MAAKASSTNGHNRLEQALATLLQTQASFVASLRETDRLHTKYERESAERFARIEAQMAEIIRILNEHGRLLEDHGRIIEALPEAVREKIGFRQS